MKDDFRLQRSNVAGSLSLLKRDTMSVHGWLKRLERSGHTCLQDLIYVYHGLAPLLREYSTKLQFLRLDDIVPEHAQLAISLTETLVRGVDN